MKKILPIYLHFLFCFVFSYAANAALLINELEGKWKAEIGGASAEIIVIKNMYQLTLQLSVSDVIERYNLGYIKYNEKNGMLTLTPDNKTQAPNKRKGIVYKTITQKPFDVFVISTKNADQIKWVPPKELIKSRQIHPLFYYMLTEEPYILNWVKIKEDAKQ